MGSGEAKAQDQTILGLVEEANDRLIALRRTVAGTFDKQQRELQVDAPTSEVPSRETVGSKPDDSMSNTLDLIAHKLHTHMAMINELHNFLSASVVSKIH